MAYNEFKSFSSCIEKHVQQRRKTERDAAHARSSVKLQAMLAEGSLIDKALAPLKLSYEEKMEYVATNSMLLKSMDGHEAIQIIWTMTQLICVHRLLSKAFREEFQAHWLGVWTEPLEGRSKHALVEEVKHRIANRELVREAVGIIGEIQFAVSPAVVLPSYETRQ